MEIAKVLDNNIRFTATETEVVSRVAVGDRKSPVIEVKTRQSQQVRMEAEAGSTTNSTMKLVPWREDWDQFKRLFKAQARLNGVPDAVKAGEALAKSRNGLVKAEIRPDDEVTK